MTTDLLIIAEAGVNHNGSLDRALEMVDVAADAGADVIKFQTFSADKLARKDAQLAEYQKTSDGDTRSQWDLLKGLELSHSDFLAIRERCAERGIVFLSTGFDLDELRFLVTEIEIPMVKIASGDLTFAPMLFDAGLTGLPVILSTGMADLAEIEKALGFIAVGFGVKHGLLDADAVPTAATRELAWNNDAIRALLVGNVTILHCTTQYPAPLEILNLRAMVTISEAFGIPVGYSDHSLGGVASTIAVSLGATVIEKHFTLDKELEGPDHAASLDVPELNAFVARLREVGVALGSPVKACQPEEVSNRAAVRRSLVARVPIAAGETITADHLESRRPGAGRTSFDFYEVVGTAAQQDYAVGEYLG
ncbi:N-acetylneuraminate synthase [Glaciihabitans arcticus]|uniref:N-acetylneuraminate synthase n=1 Tax=Glaciihabitans arcticus TaxID=2668039 RepID=A0A4Q9GUW5_9MICO|nr:N-acetylneuraminate synthase family protein [Glaciihabitans arcticus]TBN55960.1 N-acetylneuraminate synthase [Glaciihabitans arcticus]